MNNFAKQQDINDKNHDSVPDKRVGRKKSYDLINMLLLIRLYWKENISKINKGGARL